MWIIFYGLTAIDKGLADTEIELGQKGQTAFLITGIVNTIGEPHRGSVVLMEKSRVDTNDRWHPVSAMHLSVITDSSQRHTVEKLLSLLKRLGLNYSLMDVMENLWSAGAPGRISGGNMSAGWRNRLRPLDPRCILKSHFKTDEEGIVFIAYCGNRYNAHYRATITPYEGNDLCHDSPIRYDMRVVGNYISLGIQ